MLLNTLNNHAVVFSALCDKVTIPEIKAFMQTIENVIVLERTFYGLDFGITIENTINLDLNEYIVITKYHPLNLPEVLVTKYIKVSSHHFYVVDLKRLMDYFFGGRPDADLDGALLKRILLNTLIVPGGDSETLPHELCFKTKNGLDVLHTAVLNTYYC